MGNPSHETKDQEVTELAQRLSEVIERAAPEERAELREFAKELVFERTEHVATPVDQRAPESEDLSFVATLLPLLVAGLFLLFVLPPVGVVFLLLGIGVALWGTVQRLITGGNEGDHALGRRPT